MKKGKTKINENIYSCLEGLTKEFRWTREREASRPSNFPVFSFFSFSNLGTPNFTASH